MSVETVVERTRQRRQHGGTSIRRQTVHIKNPALANAGRSKIEWAESQMPVLMQIRARAARTKPLKGVRVACCLHVTTETAHLMVTLKAAGAQPALCASNPLSTQDDVAASLVKHAGIAVYAIRGEHRGTEELRELSACAPSEKLDLPQPILRMCEAEARERA
jgi:adenosylhomocysteinase